MQAIRLRSALASLIFALAAACDAPGASPSATASLPEIIAGAGPASTAGATPIPTPSATPAPAIPGQPLASTSALPKAQLPLAEFSRDGQPLAALRVEVPRPAEYNIGLSGRPTLEPDRGMLFYYPKMARGSFWMKDTHFDLAIAFVADDGRIVDIIEMQRESTSIVTPRADYRYAIEAPAGWYLAKGIRLGDRANLAFPLPSYLTDQ